MKKLYARLLGFISVDHPSPGLKQLPLAGVFVMSLVLVIFDKDIVLTSFLSALIGVILMIAATVLAAVLTILPRFDRWAIVIPLVDFLAIGLFGNGTGGHLSLFGAEIVLPVVWVAAERGRRYIVLAAAGTAVALITPYVLGTDRFVAAGD